MKLALVLTVGLVAATPALAGGVRHSRAHAYDCRTISVGDQQCGRGRRGDPYSVYSYDGRLIGRDPDPNVRMRLRDEDAFFRYR